MTTILNYQLKKKGRPKISKGTLFLEGYGISLRINNKKLLIINGKEQEITRLEIRNGSYNLTQESYFTGLTDRADFDRIIIQGSGYITFDAMQWLTEWGISVIMIDKRGKLYGNFNQVSGNTEPLIRQKQYDCFRNESKLEFLRKWVVSHKVSAQIMILRELESFNAIDKMDKQLLALENANTHSLTEISQIESVSAHIYYTALSRYFLQINPDLGSKTRTNRMTGRNNDANDIINSLLNYGFGIIQAEIGKQLNGIGLDCNIGFYHRNHISHSPLIWDMMEHFRYLVDKSVLQICSTIKNGEYHYERGNIGYPFPNFENKASKRWLIMSKDLTRRYIKALAELLETKRYQKAYVGSHTEHGFQEMREITIMKMRCLELRDYILERKRTLSAPPMILEK